MALGSKDRFVWDATVTLEALGAAEVVLWNWDPEGDRLRVTGAARAIGLSPLAPECASAAALALCLPQDRALMENVLTVQPPGTEVTARIRMRGGQSCIWRGEWLEEGGARCAGVVAPESKFAASDKDALTGLLDRRSFVSRARELLQINRRYTLVVADLDRLRRLNEALGHERADLVLAALGSRLAMESDLRGAIGRGEIVPYYQPVVRLRTGAISGFEALARWRHPRRGLIAPDQFLPLCDEMGLLVELGAHMMRESALQLAKWRRTHQAAGEITVSVNLSTGEIDRPNLLGDLSDLLAETGLPRGALKLEITESDIMRDPEQAAIILTKLREAGAGLALDDFGTGFSSLSYLTRLPFDTLKIDRYFVRTMGSNTGSAKIVRSVVNLGRDLALEVVAEGVENAEMARYLLDIGCDYGQGFGYAPALSAQEAEVYLNESYADGAAPVKLRG